MVSWGAWRSKIIENQWKSLIFWWFLKKFQPNLNEIVRNFYEIVTKKNWPLIGWNGKRFRNNFVTISGNCWNFFREFRFFVTDGSEHGQKCCQRFLATPLIKEDGFCRKKVLVSHFSLCFIKNKIVRQQANNFFIAGLFN